jgi:hypothetical protein
MSHRDPASGRALEARHFAYIVLGLVPLSFWSCGLTDATNLDINAAGSGGSSGGAAGSGGSGGSTMTGAGGSGGATGGSSGSPGTGATGGSSGAAGAGGSAGTGGTPEDPDGGVDAAVPDSGGAGGGLDFNCTSGDSACALCQVWTQLVGCQPAATCPNDLRTAFDGAGCDTQYTAYLSCFATEPVTSSECSMQGTPSIRLADTRLNGTGTENNCQAQECAFYMCLGALPSCP